MAPPGIYDIPTHSGDTCFNPSLAHITGNYYLMAFREFSRYPDFKVREKIDPYMNPNHPWLGGCNAKTWWRGHSNGHDRTRLAVIRISDSGVITVSNLTKEIVYGVDARVFKFDEEHYICSYNTFSNSDQIYIKGKTCRDHGHCCLMSMCIIRVRNGELDVYDHTPVICAGVSQLYEKNWSFIKLHGQLAFSYGLYPNHIMYFMDAYYEDGWLKVKDPGNSIPHSVSEIYGVPRQKPSVKKLGAFGKVQSQYNRHGEFLYLSLSTPGIELFKAGNKSYYLAAGHLKYNYSKMSPRMKDTHIGKFHQYICDKELGLHSVYVYLGFIYLYNDAGRIVMTTPFFLPNDKESYALAFMSGLTVANNKAYLSYGSMDQSCKLISFEVPRLLSIMTQDVSADLIPVAMLDPYLDEQVYDLTGNYKRAGDIDYWAHLTDKITLENDDVIRDLIDAEERYIQRRREEEENRWRQEQERQEQERRSKMEQEDRDREMSNAMTTEYQERKRLEIERWEEQRRLKREEHERAEKEREMALMREFEEWKREQDQKILARKQEILRRLEQERNDSEIRYHSNESEYSRYTRYSNFKDHDRSAGDRYREELERAGYGRRH